MPPPRVSVCIDVYNYAEFLPAAIESVLSQSFEDFEAIVVDDCSTDASFEVAQQFAAQDSRVKAYRNEQNLGMVRNRNACLRRATGDYVKFLHADDLLCSPDALARLVAKIEELPGPSLVACGMQFVDEKGTVTGRSRSIFADGGFIAGTSVIARCLGEQRNLIGGPSATMFRRDRAARGFDESYFHAADLEMWLHLLEQGAFGFVSDPLVAYRWHGRQQTEKDRATLSQSDDQRAMISTYLDKPYIRMRSWQKRFLRHDSVRQALRRCGKLKLRDRASELLAAYGAGSYYTRYPAFLALRNIVKWAPALNDRLLPPVRRSRADLGAGVTRPGVNVAGFFQGEYGIGESSRAFARTVGESGVPHTLVNIASRHHSNRDSSGLEFSSNNPFGINLMTFSFDYARRFHRDMGPAFSAGRYNIGIWYWELEKFPARYHSNFDYYDEIWAPSAFCEQAFAAVSPVPVRRITYPMYWEGDAAPNRGAFGLPESDFVFLFNFDFFSTVARKNPMAVLAAFRTAFEGVAGVTLALKSINSQNDPQARQHVEEAVKGLNVVWIERHLSGNEMRCLFASADSYVSLHRSEGLGLGMAQAMALGKPVVATGYSGSLEYMSAENSYLVDYELREIEADCGPWNQPPAYEKGGVWAEPSIEHAATLMRRVFEHRDESTRIGELGREAVRSALSPEKTRREILERLRAIDGRLS